MRASLIIAAHNEGNALMRTVETCEETAIHLEYEIILVDDASSDRSVDRVLDSFPNIRSARNSVRTGASPAKALGASMARGDVLVFLDGHTSPEPGALVRLVEDVELLGGNAVVTPTLAQLDVVAWRILTDQQGHGYRIDLRTMSAAWQALRLWIAQTVAGRQFYETPSLVGCALAVPRKL